MLRSVCVCVGGEGKGEKQDHTNIVPYMPQHVLVLLTSTVVLIVSDGSKSRSCWTDTHFTVCP